MVIEKNFNSLSDRELINYVEKNNLKIGNWYTPGMGVKLKLVGFVNDSYWGWCLVFNDRGKYRISLPFWWTTTKRPYKRKTKNITVVTERKQIDSNYYYLKQRHSDLCDKKLKLHNQGEKYNNEECLH